MIDPIKFIPYEDLQWRRIKRAEEACKNANNDDWKSFWFDTFKKLCEKYNKMVYYRKVIH